MTDHYLLPVGREEGGKGGRGEGGKGGGGRGEGGKGGRGAEVEWSRRILSVLRFFHKAL